jgi:hypothetical protein
VKEALKRASSEERQQYAKLLQQKSALAQRMLLLSTQQEALNKRDRLNVLPEKPNYGNRASASRQARQAADNASGKYYREALEAYRIENSANLAQRIKLVQEFLALKAEFDGLEETEKWLLLSMAIRNQSSLLGFMQNKEESSQASE